MKPWKLFIDDNQFCKTFSFKDREDSCQNLFIGSLLLCNTDYTQLSATGTDEGYCVCVRILENLHKDKIDSVLELIDSYYTEALEEN